MGFFPPLSTVNQSCSFGGGGTFYIHLPDYRLYDCRTYSTRKEAPSSNLSETWQHSGREITVANKQRYQALLIETSRSEAERGGGRRRERGSAQQHRPSWIWLWSSLTLLLRVCVRVCVWLRYSRLFSGGEVCKVTAHLSAFNTEKIPFLLLQPTHLHLFHPPTRPLLFFLRLITPLLLTPDVMPYLVPSSFIPPSLTLPLRLLCSYFPGIICTCSPCNSPLLL